MNPAQARRLRREQAEQLGHMDVYRNGNKVATLVKGEPQGTRRVRPWEVHMADGRVLPAGFYIGPAEELAWKTAAADEAR